MQTISISYKGKFYKITQEIKNELGSKKRQADGKGPRLYSDGVVDTYGYLLTLCWKIAKSDCCFVSMERIASMKCRHIRTVQRWMQTLQDDGFISLTRKWVNDAWRNVWVINAHPAVVDLLKRLNVTVNFTDEDGEKAEDAKELENDQNFEAPGASEGQTDTVPQRQIVKKTGQMPQSLSSPLIKEQENLMNTHPPTPLGGEAAAGAAEGREDIAAPKAASEASVEEAPKLVAAVQPSAPEAGNQLWLAALALLEATIPASECQLWLKPVQAIGDTQSLQLICDNKFVCAWIQEHYGKALKKVMNEIGVQKYSLTVATSSPELSQRNSEEELKKKKIAEDTERQRIDSLPVREKFATLLFIYPRKDENRGQGRAFKLFKKLVREKMIPSTYDLMVFINNQKRSEDWKKKDGKYIPSLYTLLSDMPWVKFLPKCQPTYA